MSSKPSRALYVTEDTQFVVRSDIIHDEIAEGELLVETHYSGINPGDIRHATHLGINSTVLGYDFSGRVLKTSLSSRFSEGDIIAGYTPSSIGRPLKYGAHQSYLVVPDDMAFRVPQNLPESHAAALAVVVMTAADVLHNLFQFPLPTDTTKEFLAPILIWGGSSAVGLSAIQLARASGCRNIFTTASPSRHELLKRLGATETFDYSSPNVVAEIASAVAALGKGPISHALDAAGSMGNPSSADLVAQSVEDATVLASVIGRQERFKMPVAMTNDDWRIKLPGAVEPISIPARPASHWHAWKALSWVIENYGQMFELPSVRVVDATAEEALEELFSVADGKHGFGKVVLKHPLR